MHSTDALPLPPSPDLDQYRKLAKDLLAALKSDEPDAVAHWARSWFRNLMRLTREAEGRDAENWAEGFTRDFVQYWEGKRPRKDVPPPRRTLAGTQLVLARVHGFSSWAALVKHIEERAHQGTEITRFEEAVDAIVGGDLEKLQRMLREHPALVHERSSRGHHATLLHYVSANGVEGYRQKTPPNIVEITKLLLSAGADVNATATCYGNHDRPLDLTATSMHPANAGVMIELLSTLVDAGAYVDRKDDGWGIVRSCLANGQGEAAAWLAEHGAPLDLEEAAGVGKLDVVKSYVAEDGSLGNGATPEQLRKGFEGAVSYGHHDVVDFLLARGFDPTDVREGEASALHSAAYAGDQQLVDLLIERGVPANQRENTHGGTPIEWALYAWGSGPADEPTDPKYYGVVASIARAGGGVAPGWLEENVPRGRVRQRIKEDPKMLAALVGGVV
jgi:ankyrin repeat protein